MIKVAKFFRYSMNGVTCQDAFPGDDAGHVPANLRAGLLKEGFLIDDGMKSMPSAPENKAMAPSVQNKEAATQDEAGVEDEGDASENDGEEAATQDEDKPRRGRPKKVS